jgi:hypothetical protein
MYIWLFFSKIENFIIKFKFWFLKNLNFPLILQHIALI